MTKPVPPPLNCRHIFLFDTAVIVCKRRGDNYEMKEVIDLHLFKITDNPTSDKENRKVCQLFFSPFPYFSEDADAQPASAKGRYLTASPERFPHTAGVLTA